MKTYYKWVMSFLLVAGLLLSSCATSQQLGDIEKRLGKLEGEPPGYEIVPAPPGEPGDVLSLEELQDLAESGQAVKIRAFTGLTGEATGTLDNIDVASLTDGDLAFVYVIASGTVRFFEFNDNSSYAAEVIPYWITPKNGANGAGGDKWEGLSSFGFAPSTDPETVWRDLDATDFDKNARIFISCNDGSCASGSEDVDVAFQAQVGGTENVTYILFNCDASGNCDVEITPQGLGTVELMDNGLSVDGVLATTDDTYRCFASVTGINVGEDIAQWDAVFMNSADGEWHKADATTALDEWPAVGFAVECSDGAWPCTAVTPDTLTVCLSGVIRNDAWTWTDHGVILYLDEVTSGGLTETAPSTAGDAIQVLAIAIRNEAAGDAEDVILFPVPAWGEDDGS